MKPRGSRGILPGDCHGARGGSCDSAGHGKTLVTAVALGPGARLYQPALLGLATTLTHMGSVLLIAAFLWYTGATQVGTVHTGLTQNRRIRDRGSGSLAHRSARRGLRRA